MNDFNFEIAVPAYHETPEGKHVRTSYECQVAAIYAVQLLANIFDQHKKIKINRGKE